MPPIDLKVIEAMREIDEAGGMEVAKEVLRCFLKNAYHDVARVSASIIAGDGKALGYAAHELRSSTANVGARILSGHYRELEKLGREGRIDEARRLLDQVRREHERAVMCMREILTEAG